MALNKSRMTTVLVILSSVLILAAMAFIGWAIHEMSNENRRLHKQHRADSALIEELTAQVSGHESPVNNVPSPSPGPTPAPPEQTSIWARPALNAYPGSSSGRVISTGPR